jgi:hypothetical protein
MQGGKINGEKTELRYTTLRSLDPPDQVDVDFTSTLPEEIQQSKGTDELITSHLIPGRSDQVDQVDISKCPMGAASKVALRSLRKAS